MVEVLRRCTFHRTGHHRHRRRDRRRRVAHEELNFGIARGKWILRGMRRGIGSWMRAIRRDMEQACGFGFWDVGSGFVSSIVVFVVIIEVTFRRLLSWTQQRLTFRDIRCWTMLARIGEDRVHRESTAIGHASALSTRLPNSGGERSAWGSIAGSAVAVIYMHPAFCESERTAIV
jgi:hypothetical protein